MDYCVHRKTLAQVRSEAANRIVRKSLVRYRHFAPWCGRDRVLHATKAEMVGAGIGFAFAATARHIAFAVLVGAQEGAAALYALLDARFTGIETVRRALGIARHATSRGQRGIIIGTVPVAGPFPDIAGNIVEAV